MKEYLEMTKQDVTHLFGGIFTYGMSRILNEIVPAAVQERKKIVWHHTEKDIFGEASYTLEELDHQDTCSK